MGLYPPKKLTISQRVAKWFSGFKIPSTKVIYELELSTKIANFIEPKLIEKSFYYLLIFWNSAVDLVDLDFPEKELRLEVATAMVNIHLIMIITTLEMITI